VSTAALPVLCHFCAGTVRAFAAHNPHADLRHLIEQRANGCCTYWLARGIPAGWWE
jgi:hypothetical protein